jgi:DNA-binding PucR family transcriptional regulator
MAGSRDALMIMVDPETCWLWLPKSLPDNVLSAQSGPEIRIAVGAPLAGPEGFKRSLKQAQTTRRILSDANPEYAMARYDTIRSVATFTADPSARARYALECLGALLDAPPPLRRALRIYLREGSNAAETAKALGIHRNTLSQQLARAQDLLPSALNGETRLDVMMALELDHWTNHTPH